MWLFRGLTYYINPYQKVVVALVLIALQFIARSVTYDAYAGLNFSNDPYFWKVHHAGKDEVVTMVASRQIDKYGVRRGQILMCHKDGRWFSLDYFGNQDLLRKLGSQGVHYVSY
jgi:hypothetical protein